jgi:hypothetical protein
MTGQVIEYDITVDFGATFSVDTPIGYDGKHIQPMSIANNGTYDASTGKITWKADQYSGIGLVAVYQSQGGGQSGDRPFSGIVRANVTHTGAENVEPEDTATPPAWREAPAGTEATKTTCQEGTSTFAQCFPDAALATAVSKELGSTSWRVGEGDQAARQQHRHQGPFGRGAPRQSAKHPHVRQSDQ